MNYLVGISVRVDCNDNVQITFLDKIEISLDCVTCQRSLRTVIISSSDDAAICTPTRHPFPAQIVSKEIRSNSPPEVVFNLQYEFEAFTDRKYKLPAKGKPHWARVHFEVTCHRCATKFTTSIQNNIVRPWSKVCVCGYLLYAETEEFPKFQVLSVE
jgi:hypothetical protein